MLNDSDILEHLIAASRGKHLFAPHKPQLVRSFIRLFFGTGNKIDYRLRPRAGNPLPKEFIRLEPWETRYLYMVASRSKIGILEIGRFKGGSTILLSAANRNVPIYSIDIAPKNDENLRSLMGILGTGGNVKLITGDSQNTKYNEVGELDLLFIDGDHTHKGCLSDLQNWWDQLVSGGHIILHDCYFTSGVQDAVLDFIECHDVRTVTSPYICREPRFYPAGSFCHLIKTPQG